MVVFVIWYKLDGIIVTISFSYEFQNYIHISIWVNQNREKFKHYQSKVCSYQKFLGVIRDDFQTHLGI